MVCVCVCVCLVCVFGTGEEEKEVNRDRGGTCQRHRASGQQTHTQALCMALQTMMPLLITRLLPVARSLLCFF